MGSAGLNTNNMFLDKASHYKVDVTRVHKKRVAPAGKIFLVVSVKNKTKSGDTIYTSCYPILLGTPEDRINEMAQQMIDSIKKEYGL